MQRIISIVAFLSTTAIAENALKNPLGAVIELLGDLKSKVSADMAAEAKAYEEYAEYCKTAQDNLGFEIRTLTTAEEKLTATIADLSSGIEVATSKVADLAAAIATSEGELEDATSVRKKEAADFSADEAELLETIDTLGRASHILAREMAKNPASLAQIDTTSMSGLLQSMSAIVDAAALSSKDKSKLVALVQAQQSDDDDDDAPGAPAVAAYKSHSSSILDVIEDLKDKADAELASLRQAELKAQRSFALLKQGLEDQVAADTKDMSEQKAAKAEAAEGKASAEGKLAATVKSLAEAEKALELSKTNCATVTADHTSSVAGFEAELKTISEALQVLKDTTSGAVSQTYSFLQLQTQSTMRTRADLANSEVVALVRRIARDQHSAALAQLASRIASVIRYGHRNGQDPFAKVKGLITDLIEKLLKEAGADATEKAFCDEEMKKTKTKKEELQLDIEKLSTKIDKATAESTGLKEEVKALEAELAELADRAAEMEKIRTTEKADYDVAKADLTEGLEGVKKAMAILKEYYEAESASFVQQAPATPPTYSKSVGAGSSIIDILEQVEADFSKDLAEKDAAEADAVAAFEKETQEMQILKAMKEKDVEYKTKEFTALDKTIAELSSDKEGRLTELSAVLEYDEKIKERCIAKPETYAARKARRDAEIKGLKEALKILESETAFVQRRKGVRGARSSLTLQ